MVDSQIKACSLNFQDEFLSKSLLCSARLARIKPYFFRITTYRHTRMDDDAREMANFEADTDFTFSVQSTAVLKAYVSVASFGQRAPKTVVFSVQNIGDMEPDEEVTLTRAGYSFIDLVPGKRLAVVKNLLL